MRHSKASNEQQNHLLMEGELLEPCLNMNKLTQLCLHALWKLQTYPFPNALSFNQNGLKTVQIKTSSLRGRSVSASAISTPSQILYRTMLPLKSN